MLEWKSVKNAKQWAITDLNVPKGSQDTWVYHILKSGIFKSKMDVTNL